MNFIQLAERVLKEIKQPLTTMEIWDKAIELGWNNDVSTQGKTPWRTIGARLYLDIRDNPNTLFQTVGKNPVRFGLKEIAVFVEEKIDLDESTNIIKQNKFTERDLHPLLVKFADTYYHFRGAKLKTIFHENSSKQKKGYDRWIHPDLVGVYFAFNDQFHKYEKVIIDFQNDFSISAMKIFSFELKIKIDMSNLREYYFQAVSNSSWANEGYLVALKLDDEVIEEVRRLSNSFGIGLIKLDAENIEDGQIIVPSAFRKELDINTMDKLANKNPHFADFLKNVIDDNKIKKVKSSYDRVFNDKEIYKYLQDKGIVKPNPRSSA